jgi:hypothetical protein
MQEAILIMDSSFGLSDFKLYTTDSFKFEDAKEFEIEHNVPHQFDTYFSILKDNSIFDLMEPNEQSIVSSEFEMFNIYYCLFYDFHYLKILIASIPPDKKIIIDNDHGRLMRRDEFLKFNSYEEFARWP